MRLQTGVSLIDGGYRPPEARFFSNIDSPGAQYVDINLRGYAGAVVRFDWGDGAADTVTLLGESTDVRVQHSYTAAGEYAVRMSGGVNRITSLRMRTESTNNRFGAEAPFGLLGMTALTQLYLWWGRGELAPVISALRSLTVLRFVYGADALSGGESLVCDLDEVDVSRFTEFGVSAAVGGGFTGDLASLSDHTALQNLFLTATGVTGELADLSGCTSLVKVYLQDSRDATGDIADIAGLSSLTHFYALGGGVDAYTGGAVVKWASNVRLHAANLTALTAGEIADLLQDMLTSRASWSGAVVTVSGCNRGSCSETDINTARGIADWLQTTVEPAGITVNTD